VRRASDRPWVQKRKGNATDPLAHVMSTREVADALGVEPGTIRAYAARGQMPQPSGRFGRELFWTLEAVTPWIDGVKARRQ
jgi:predicted DNA-binding transcriptional regulator AlpA